MSALAGKVAVVTGAAQGIGKACAVALAAEGAKVVCGDLDRDGAMLAAADVGGVGFGVDVTKPDECEALAREAVEHFGRLDVLVTCAGVSHRTPFDRITPEEWDRVLAVNLRGTFLCAQAALRVMIPPMTSQYLNVLKNSSFGAAIAYPELVSVFMGSALNNTGQAIEIIAIVLAVYLSIGLAVSALMNWYNARMTLVTR